MTAVIIWLNRENKDNSCIWGLADTRISSENLNGNKRLLDIYPKIFELPIKICVDQTQLRFSKIHSFGIAFAGNTLIGSATKEILSYLFSSLSTHHPIDLGIPVDFSKALLYSIQHVHEYNDTFREQLPSLLEISYTVKNIIKQLIDSSIQNQPYSDDKVGLEFCIFGYCLDKKEFCAYKITAKKLLNPNHEYYTHIQSEEKIFDSNSNELEFILLGDKKEQITNLIEEKKAELHNHPKNYPYWRSPCYVMSNIIEEDSINSIGGNAQLLTVSERYTQNTGIDNKNSVSYYGFKLFEKRNNFTVQGFKNFYFTPKTIQLDFIDYKEG